ncbi:MAG: PQQ-like beta-propeller repeat protein [Chloroflexi bacterium]|nr:PQQ-like beta-propeller repeat protein [Chloroflexota bacterium]
MRFIKRIPHYKLALLGLMLAGILVLGACAGTATVPRGWSGPVIVNDDLVMATMEGNLVALDLATRTRLWPDLKFEPRQTTGTFGCAGGPTSVAIYATPGAANDLAYVGGYDGKVYAVSLTSGSLRWVYPRQDYIEPIVGAITPAGGMIFFGASDGKVYALDAATGDFKWSFATGNKVWSSPVVDGDTVYVTSMDKKIYALRAADGTKRWEFATEGAITSNPVVGENVVYFGSFDRYVYAVNRDGSLRWRSAQADNWFWANPLLYNNTIYAGALDDNLYAFRADNGATVGKFDLGSPVSASPVRSGESVVAVTEAGKLFVLNTANNTIKELANLQQSVFAPLAVHQGTAYVHTDRDELFAIDIQSGVTLWMLPLKTS